MSSPLSMTCFGRGEAGDGTRTWTVEVRSVNHRYCDVSVRMPRSWAAIEERIKKAVARRFSRGKVDVTVDCRGDAGSGLRLDLELARQYHQGLLRLKKEFSLAGQADLALLASCRDVFVQEDREEDMDRLWDAVEPALQEALANGLAMRRREGENLKNDLTARLAGFREMLGRIEQQAPVIVERRAALLRERLARLLDDMEADEMRLAQEIALLADKVDISEEIVRLYSHLDQFGHFLEAGEPVGRRLDFLLQEFLREINTMASKIGDVQVTHLVVELKNEVEKMREQVQNLE